MAKPSGYPFSVTAEDEITKIYANEWNDIRKFLNFLAEAGGGIGHVVMRDARWYDNGTLFGCRETGGINLIPGGAYAYPVAISKSGFVTDLAANVWDRDTGRTAKLGIWEMRGDGSPGTLLGSGEIDVTGTGGVWQSLITPIHVAVSPGIYWVGLCVNSNSLTFQTWQFENMSPVGRNNPDEDAIGHVQMSGISGITLVDWGTGGSMSEWSGNAGTNLVRILYKWEED